METFDFSLQGKKELIFPRGNVKSTSTTEHFMREFLANHIHEWNKAEKKGAVTDGEDKG